MQETNLYEYAIIRVVPRVEREEFLNVGIILYCKDKNFLQVRSYLNEQKLTSLCNEVDCAQIKENLDSFEKICRGDKDAGSIAQLDLPSRFRWLTAVRSAVVQTSRPHPGFSPDPESTLLQLFEELVL